MEQAESKIEESTWKNRIIILLVIAIVLMGGGFWYYQRSTYVYTDDAQIDGYYVEISPDILARIITLEVDEGDFVEQGDLITKLDDSILQSEFKEKTALIETKKDELAFQKAHFEKVQNDFYRAEKGFRDLLISEQEYDHHEKAYKMATASLQRAESDVAHAETELGVIQAKLLHTLVVAPRSGYIAKRWVLAGDVMVPGQTMFSLYDLDNIWVLARVDEGDIQHVRLGDPVDIYFDAYPGKKFQGEVYVIKAAAASQFTLIPQDNATGNYTKVAQRVPVKISIQKPKGEDGKSYYFFPGMSAEVKIRIAK